MVHILTVNPDTGEDTPGIGFSKAVDDRTVVKVNNIGVYTASVNFTNYTDTQSSVIPVAKGDKVTYHNEKNIPLYNDPPTGVTPEPVVVNGTTYYKYVDGGGQSSPAKITVNGVEHSLFAAGINDKPIIRPAMFFFPCKA